jgi:hypothetical protein
MTNKEKEHLLSFQPDSQFARLAIEREKARKKGTLALLQYYEKYQPDNKNLIEAIEKEKQRILATRVVDNAKNITSK